MFFVKRADYAPPLAGGFVKRAVVSGFDWTPATYVVPNVEPTLVASFSQTETRTFTKVGGVGDWNDWVYSVEGITGDQAVKFKFPNVTKQAMIGLIQPVPASAGWEKIDFAFYMGGGAAAVYDANDADANGVATLDYTGNGNNDGLVEWEVRYTGTTVALYRAGVATGRSFATTAGRTFHVGAVFYDTADCTVRDLKHMAL